MGRVRFNLLVVGHGPRLLSDSTLDAVESCFTSPSFLLILIDRDRFHDPFRLWPDEINRQQAVFQVGAHNLHPIAEHKCALELTRGYTAVEILAGLVVLLPPTDHQLAFLDAHIALIAGESGNRERDTQPLGTLSGAREPPDVVRGVTVPPSGN